MPSHTYKMEYLNNIFARYHKVSRQEKSTLLDELSQHLRCHRKHAIRLLAGPPPNPASLYEPKPRGRRFRYSHKTLRVLDTIWRASGFICSQRLKAALPAWIPSARQHLAITPAIERELLAISPRQIDRRLSPQKNQLKRRLYGTTSPGTRIKHLVPIRTDFWKIRRPGFLEIDLVSHSGPHAAGDFIHTLNSVDIHTTWNEKEAILGKSEAATVDGLRKIEHRLPFALQGIDSDSGSEFINHHLWTFCRARPPHRKVYFTRSRPGRKNDNAHIEQKNGSHVRQIIGYDRYDSPKALALMNSLYADLRIQQNIFQASMKLLKKIHKGSRLIRRYDRPRSALQRVIESPQADPSKMQELLRIKANTDPFVLADRINHKLAALFALAAKPTPGQRTAPNPDHPWRTFSFSTKLKRRKSIFKKCNTRWLNKFSKKGGVAR